MFKSLQIKVFRKLFSGIKLLFKFIYLLKNFLNPYFKKTLNFFPLNIYSMFSSSSQEFNILEFIYKIKSGITSQERYKYLKMNNEHFDYTLSGVFIYIIKRRSFRFSRIVIYLYSYHKGGYSFKNKITFFELSRIVAFILIIFTRLEILTKHSIFLENGKSATGFSSSFVYILNYKSEISNIFIDVALTTHNSPSFSLVSNYFFFDYYLRSLLITLSNDNRINGFFHSMFTGSLVKNEFSINLNTLIVHFQDYGVFLLPILIRVKDNRIIFLDENKEDFIGSCYFKFSVSKFGFIKPFFFVQGLDFSFMFYFFNRKKFEFQFYQPEVYKLAALFCSRYLTNINFSNHFEIINWFKRFNLYPPLHFYVTNGISSASYFLLFCIKEREGILTIISLKFNNFSLFPIFILFKGKEGLKLLQLTSLIVNDNIFNSFLIKFLAKLYLAFPQYKDSFLFIKNSDFFELFNKLSSLLIKDLLNKSLLKFYFKNFFSKFLKEGKFLDPLFFKLARDIFFNIFQEFFLAEISSNLKSIFKVLLNNNIHRFFINNFEFYFIKFEFSKVYRFNFNFIEESFNFKIPVYSNNIDEISRFTEFLNGFLLVCNRILMQQIILECERLGILVIPIDGQIFCNIEDFTKLQVVFSNSVNVFYSNLYLELKNGEVFKGLSNDDLNFILSYFSRLKDNLSLLRPNIHRSSSGLGTKVEELLNSSPKF